MKFLIRVPILFATLIITLSVVSIQPAMAQDCLTQLKQMNQLGIPPAKHVEYEKCVSELSLNQKSNKDLLKDCYNKLISYYDKYDNNEKVNKYKADLAKLTAPEVKVQEKAVVKDEKIKTSVTGEKKDSAAHPKN